MSETLHTDLCNLSLSSRRVGIVTDPYSNYTVIESIEVLISRLTAQIRAYCEVAPNPTLQELTELYITRTKLCSILKHNWVQSNITEFTCTRCERKTYLFPTQLSHTLIDVSDTIEFYQSLN
jgi:hypothetical protein